MSNKIKASNANGINVTITKFKTRYKVEILIPEVKSQKEIYVKNNDFIFRLKMKSKWYGPIKIILNESYKKDVQGLIDIHNYAKLEFDEKKYCGTISLSPIFYLSPKERKKVREEKKKNQQLTKALKKCILIPCNKPKPSGSIYTNYKYNNATKPYSGGKVSPK